MVLRMFSVEYGDGALRPEKLSWLDRSNDRKTCQLLRELRGANWRR